MLIFLSIITNRSKNNKLEKFTSDVIAMADFFLEDSVSQDINLTMPHIHDHSAFINYVNKKNVHPQFMGMSLSLN